MRILFFAAAMLLISFALHAETVPGVESRNSAPVLTLFTATPNPARLGEPVTFKLNFAIHSIRDSSGFISFGDGTFQSLATDSAEFDSLVKGTLTHTYTTLPANADAFRVVAQIQHGPFTVQTSLFVRVGFSTVVEPVDGVGQTLTDINGTPGVGSRYVGGFAAIRVFFTRTQGTTATTVFEDPVANDTQVGLNVSHTYTVPGIYVATSTGAGSSGDIGRSRKMINVSSRDVGDSAALPDAPDTTIVLGKMSGKFSFTDPSKIDKVTFSGRIKLPAGFHPALEGGNKLIVGIGNIIDEVTVDGAGKATPGVRGNITKAKIKYPKLATPAAAGGEIATVDVTFAGANLSSRGYDTEGISATLVDGEETLKAVSRIIQVDMQLAGVPYEGAAPVDFKRAKNGASGAIKGIPTRSAVKF